MNTNGFYISKLAIAGLKVPEAVLQFKTGLNVLSGPSNTGKSLVFACINFCFGSETLTISVPQLAGYERIGLELKTYAGKTYSLIRSIVNHSRIEIKQTSLFEKVEQKEKKFVYVDFNKPNNISEFLLSISGFPGEPTYIVSSQYLEKKPLTFRDIFGFIGVDEVKIQTLDSVINHTGQLFDKTRNKAVFDFILSGENANELTTLDKPEISNAKINAQIEFIDSLIKDIDEQLEKFANLDLPDSENIDKSLSALYSKLDKATQDLNALTTRKDNVYNFLTKTKSEILFKNELLIRFSLLQDHYNTDLKRLEFISEADHYFAQLITVECPICGGALNKEHFDCIDNTFKKEDLIQGVEKESEKIYQKYSDLSETIDDLRTDIINLENLRQDNENEFQEIVNTLKEQLEPITIDIKNAIKELIDNRLAVVEYNALLNDKNKYFNQRSQLSNSLNKRNPNKPAASRYSDRYYYREFNNQIEVFLDQIKYSDLTRLDINKVDFNVEVLDFLINNRARKNNGKGVRAILYSAFIISLMNHCILINRPHPKLVILDSPLTTYHGKEVDNSKNEDVNANLQNSFFSLTANTPTDRQVIIIENKMPQVEIREKMNFIEFTNDPENGRQGFIPTPKGKLSS